MYALEACGSEEVELELHPPAPRSDRDDHSLVEIGRTGGDPARIRDDPASIAARRELVLDERSRARVSTIGEIVSHACSSPSFTFASISSGYSAREFQ